MRPVTSTCVRCRRQHPCNVHIIRVGHSSTSKGEGEWQGTRNDVPLGLRQCSHMYDISAHRLSTFLSPPIVLPSITIHPTYMYMYIRT